MKLSFAKTVIKATRATIFPQDLANSKRTFVAIYAVRLLFLVGRRLVTDRCPRLCAALAYETLLALVPTAFLVLAGTARIAPNLHIDDLIGFVDRTLVPQAAIKVTRYIKSTAAAIQPGALGLLGAASFFVIALTLFLTVEQIVNEIFRCKKNRPLYLRIPLSALLLLLVPALMGSSIYFATRTIFVDSQLVGTLFPLGVTIGGLFVTYFFLPHRKVRKRHSLISAVVAGLGLELVRFGFSLYVTYMGKTLSYVYGTLAIIPMFMVWIYLMWIIFLFGAELNAALHEVRHFERLSQ